MHEPPPIRFTLTLDASDSAILTEYAARLHRENGRPYSRSEAMREALRRSAASPIKAGDGAQ
jgi:hypothetical protein